MGNKDNTINNQYKILEATEKLIIKKGIESTSLSDIAKEVGISKGTLYYYYSSKNELINEIAHKYFEEITETVTTSLERLDYHVEPLEIIENAFRDILRAEGKGRLHLALIEEAVTGNEELRKKFTEEYIKWKYVIREGLRLIFKNKDLNYEILADIIVASIDGFMIQKVLHIDKIPINELTEYLIENKNIMKIRRH